MTATRKTWGLRILTAIAVPALVLGLVEAGLRIGGYGRPAGFTFRDPARYGDRILTNPHFGHTYFDPRLAREPAHFTLPPEKPKGTFRIFVLGGSAAQGDPEPAYGMARILEVMLSERKPGTRWEVLNVAMTAVNSHVVRRIARDCAALEPDALVVYLGHNEVVGPYGAGTVFAPLTRSPVLIRARITARASRIGQLMRNVARAMTPPVGERGTWQGMGMFTKHEVRASDPRLATVHRHFDRNLRAICALARRRGVPVILCTVAGNLADNPPFGSRHDPDVGSDERLRWQEAYDAGRPLEAQGDIEAAAVRYRDAEAIDSARADLQFRLGRCLQALGDLAGARERYVRARDADTLRFRADTRINETIRSVAADAGGVALADVAQAVAAQSPDGIPGGGHFYDHVHLNFPGNYLAARTILDRLLTVLPDRTRENGEGRPVLPEGVCARRLAFTGWDWHEIEAHMLARFRRPPFTGQLYHARDMAARTAGLRQAGKAHTTGPGLAKATEVYAAALRARPGDAFLHQRYARLLLDGLGDPVRAEKHQRVVTEQQPQSFEAWHDLSEILARQGRYADAIACSERALELRPKSADAMSNIGIARRMQGRLTEALTFLERALDLDPFNPHVHFNYADCLMARDPTDGENRRRATAHFRRALELNPADAGARARLEEFDTNNGPPVRDGIR